MHGAWKVGLLVLVFAGLLIFAYTLLGRPLFVPERKEYFAKFADAGGTASGTKVLMAGVPIGFVEDVKLAGPRSAVMTLKILPEIAIPEGSRAVIGSSLIGFGDSPIAIEPPAELTGRALPPGSTLIGTHKNAIESLLPDSKQTFQELNKTIASLRGLIEDPKMRGGLVSVMKTSDETIKKFGLLADQMQGMMAENRMAIKGAINSATLAMQDIRKSTALVTKLLGDPKLKNQTLAILDKLNATALKADELVASINNLVNDPKLRDPLNKIMANAETISDTGTRIAANTEKITANGVTVSAEAIELAKKANLLADEAREVLQKIKGFFDKTPGKGGIKPMEIGMDLLRETRPNYWRTDVSAEIGVPGSGTSYHVGLFDAFESNKITAQIGKNFGVHNQVRYGIYASKPGVGVDFQIAPKVEFRGDLFNINDPRLDLRIRYDFGNGIVGWAGMDRVFNGNSPVIGIGVRK